MKFITLLGKISSTLILILVFFTVIGAYALAEKLFIRVRSLFLKQTKGEGFWIDKKIRPATLKELKCQY